MSIWKVLLVTFVFYTCFQISEMLQTNGDLSSENEMVVQFLKAIATPDSNEDPAGRILDPYEQTPMKRALDLCPRECFACTAVINGIRPITCIRGCQGSQIVSMRSTWEVCKQVLGK